MRDDFAAKIKKTLSERAGFKCSNPECRKATVGANSDKNKSTSLGVAAHITAASDNGPRYDEKLNPEERSSLDNAIWLCANCSVLIDRDVKKFTKEVLTEWKACIENETASDLTAGPAKLTEYSSDKNESGTEKLSLKDRADKMKLSRRKQQELDNYLASNEAIKEAFLQAKYVVKTFKEHSKYIEDPDTYLQFETLERRDEMYQIGFKRKFLCFNLFRPYSNNINETILKITIFTSTGVWEHNRKDVNVIQNEYRYIRDINNDNGWEIGENLISSDELIREWVDKYLEYLDSN